MNKYEWAIVGAGPAGMAALGKLIDLGVPAKKIAWIDPEFKVGDFGTRWRNVSSNTKVDLFIKFLNGYNAFNYSQCKEDFALHQQEPEATCQLKHAADPLQWVTEQLKSQVHAIESTVLKLKMANQHWQLTLENSNIESKNVVLAIGSEPRLMESSVPVIPLEDALDNERIQKWVDETDTVAVFGASHSAMIVIRLLLENGVKKVINFYQSALRFAVYLDDFILFDNTGLKGETAKWTRENIDGKVSDRLERIWSNDDNVKAFLPQCTKSVQAIGFARRNILIEGLPVITYNDKSGIIAPGLFGCGIAFPETTVDPFGNVEASVGLWKFMKYLNRVVPVWQKYTV